MSFGSFSLAGAYVYALCVFGAVNTQGFVRTFFFFFLCAKYKFHSFHENEYI